MYESSVEESRDKLRWLINALSQCIYLNDSALQYIGFSPLPESRKMQPQ